mmetsp:Transcript_11851/g.19307  ORF Transcript_11851/g.19307 Transcript_11851/m.19307 type:complete len:83 (-) Transcript_11851:98-346(-)
MYSSPDATCSELVDDHSSEANNGRISRGTDGNPVKRRLRAWNLSACTQCAGIVQPQDLPNGFFRANSAKGLGVSKSSFDEFR